MSVPTAPIHLPPVTFLMSDHTTSALAVDVAEVLSSANATLYIDDFLAPIEQAMTAMFDLDFARDLGNPKETHRLMLESLDGESTERDVMVSLEKWFIDTFGELQLGKMGLKRMRVNREMFDYPYLFRDATPKHIVPFIADTSIARRDMLIVYLTPHSPSAPQPANVTMLTWSETPTLEQVVLAIEGACR